MTDYSGLMQNPEGVGPHKGPFLLFPPSFFLHFFLLFLLTDTARIQYDAPVVITLIRVGASLACCSGGRSGET